MFETPSWLSPQASQGWGDVAARGLQLGLENKRIEQANQQFAAQQQMRAAELQQQANYQQAMMDAAAQEAQMRRQEADKIAAQRFEEEKAKNNLTAEYHRQSIAARQADAQAKMELEKQKMARPFSVDGSLISPDGKVIYQAPPKQSVSPEVKQAEAGLSHIESVLPKMRVELIAATNSNDKAKIEAVQQQIGALLQQKLAYDAIIKGSSAQPQPPPIPQIPSAQAAPKAAAYSGGGSWSPAAIPPKTQIPEDDTAKRLAAFKPVVVGGTPVIQKAAEEPVKPVEEPPIPTPETVAGSGDDRNEYPVADTVIEPEPEKKKPAPAPKKTEEPKQFTQKQIEAMNREMSKNASEIERIKRKIEKVQKIQPMIVPELVKQLRALEARQEQLSQPWLMK